MGNKTRREPVHLLLQGFAYFSSRFTCGHNIIQCLIQALAVSWFVQRGSESLKTLEDIFEILGSHMDVAKALIEPAFVDQTISVLSQFLPFSYKIIDL